MSDEPSGLCLATTPDEINAHLVEGPHRCGYAEGHEGAHRCGACGQEWEATNG